jgi:short-subunit dehydrogenase
MARQLGQEGCRLALTGRRQEKLKEAGETAKTAGAPQVLELLGDAAKREDVERHYKAIKDNWGGLDWAILNAGVGDSSTAMNFSADNVRWTFETNVFGVAEWMQAVLPDMIAAKSGTVAAVSSLAAFRGMPGAGSYCASKAALNALLEASRVELRASGVKIVTICPGFVKSEMTDRNDPGQMPFLLETEDGARRMIEGIRKGQRLVHFPAPLSVPMVYLMPNVPRFLYDLALSRFRKRKKPYVDESKKS